jgi:hypothetical protein
MYVLHLTSPEMGLCKSGGKSNKLGNVPYKLRTKSGTSPETDLRESRLWRQSCLRWITFVCGVCGVCLVGWWRHHERFPRPPR